MDSHLRIAAYLNAGLGILGLIACLIALILFGGPKGVLLINARVGSAVTTTEGFVTACVLVFLFLMAGPQIAVGLGLLRFEEWARNLGMILSILSMVIIPIGTIVGVYSLWVLTSFEVEPLFKSPLRRP